MFPGFRHRHGSRRRATVRVGRQAGNHCQDIRLIMLDRHQTRPFQPADLDKQIVLLPMAHDVLEHLDDRPAEPGWRRHRWRFEDAHQLLQFAQHGEPGELVGRPVVQFGQQPVEAGRRRAVVLRRHPAKSATRSSSAVRRQW
jgi:hypothetical protein